MCTVPVECEGVNWIEFPHVLVTLFLGHGNEIINCIKTGKIHNLIK
jgi:hypothetical protein